MFKIILVAVMTAMINKSHFCSCTPVTVRESVERSDLIFTGVVLKIDMANVVPDEFIKFKWATTDSGFYVQNCLVTLKLKIVYKGKVLNDTLSIMTGMGNGDCGYYFRTGKDYIIYARKRMYHFVDSIDAVTSRFRSHPREYFTTNDCDRTTDQIDKEDRLLRFERIKQ